MYINYKLQGELEIIGVTSNSFTYAVRKFVYILSVFLFYVYKYVPSSCQLALFGYRD